jgi:hypothetical protein
MKKTFLTITALSLLNSGFSQEQEFSYWDIHPIHAGVNAIRLGKAEVKAPQGGHLHFRKTNAFLYMLAPISRESYFFPRIEYNTFTLDWNKNPKFHEKRFSYVQFALTFYTIAVEKWRWITRVDYSIPRSQSKHAHEYGLFSALLWGRNEFAKDWHYHIGAFGYTGYEGEEVYPVIGFDYAPNAQWFFEAVFPLEYLIQYNVGKSWKLGLKGRPLKERFRTGKDEIQPRSVFNYSSMGAEFNVQYEKPLRAEFEAYIGYNFGGKFYIKDSEGHNALYTRIEAAPYIGANFNWGF